MEKELKSYDELYDGIFRVVGENIELEDGKKLTNLDYKSYCNFNSTASGKGKKKKFDDKINQFFEMCNDTKYDDCTESGYVAFRDMLKALNEKLEADGKKPIKNTDDFFSFKKELEEDKKEEETKVSAKSEEKVEKEKTTPKKDSDESKLDIFLKRMFAKGTSLRTILNCSALIGGFILVVVLGCLLKAPVVVASTGFFSSIGIASLFLMPRIALSIYINRKKIANWFSRTKTNLEKVKAKEKSKSKGKKKDKNKNRSSEELSNALSMVPEKNSLNDVIDDILGEDEKTSTEETETEKTDAEKNTFENTEKKEVEEDVQTQSVQQEMEHRKIDEQLSDIVEHERTSNFEYTGNYNEDEIERQNIAEEELNKINSQLRENSNNNDHSRNYYEIEAERQQLLEEKRKWESFLGLSKSSATMQATVIDDVRTAAHKNALQKDVSSEEEIESKIAAIEKEIEGYRYMSDYSRRISEGKKEIEYLRGLLPKQNASAENNNAMQEDNSVKKR